MSWCESLWVFPSWRSLSFLRLFIHIFPQIGEFLVIISSNKLYDPFFLNSHIVYIVLLYDVPQSCYSMFIFLYSFFFLCLRLSNFKFPVFKFTGSFFCWWSFPFNCSREFFNLVIVFFSFRVPLWLFLLFG